LDHDAFERLIQENERRILTIAYQICGNIEDARDIAQDTFMRAYRSRHRLRRDRSPGPWLNRIAVNSAIDFLRKRRAAKTLPLEEADHSIGQAWNPRRSTPIEEQIQNREKSERLFSLLGSLAPRERAAFVLRHLQGMTTDETARSMGCTRVTVRRHSSRALSKLRMALGEGPAGSSASPEMKKERGGQGPIGQAKKKSPGVERSRIFLGSNK
jgi:RNA polymerase sigma-70 factor (ECF subfamily)